MRKGTSWGPSNIVAGIILVILVALGGWGLDKYAQKINANKEVAGVEAQASPIVQKVISYDGADGKNALELLKAGNDIKTQDSSLGVYVTSINGTENTSDTFWMFYVNGQLAPSGAGDYITKNSDKIEWRYEQFSF